MILYYKIGVNGRGKIVELLDFLLDFFFPRTCIGCGKWGNYLCPSCVNFISVCKTTICPQCTKLSVGGLTHYSCRRSQTLNGLTSIFSYQGLVKKGIGKLKYKFMSDLAETLVELFLSCCGEDKAFTHFVSRKNVMLVPVPLHRRRYNWRGFNQAELLGKMIANKLGIGFMPDLLIRTRYTQTQTKLKKEQRLINIRNAFILNKKYYPNYSLLRQPADTNYLLFDDVWTTGSTLRECTKVIKRNLKPASVWGLTLARMEFTK